MRRRASCRSSAAAVRRAATSGLQRQRMKRLLMELEREHPGVKQSMLKALGNVAPRHLLDTRLNPPADLRTTRERRAGAEARARAAAARRHRTETVEVLMRVRLLSVACVLFVAASASAQQRPLVTEDPEPIGAGRLLIEGGFDARARLPEPGVRPEGQPGHHPDDRDQHRLELNRRTADRRRDLQQPEHQQPQSERAAGVAAHRDRRQHARRVQRGAGHQDPDPLRRRRRGQRSASASPPSCRTPRTRTASTSTPPTFRAPCCSPRRCSRSASSATSAPAF